ncbi:MAG: nickel-dependent lactate racemase [FCB group bacterium]|nr:nickel-dependent lactate racemase [FCB group bacterium]
MVIELAFNGKMMKIQLPNNIEVDNFSPGTTKHPVTFDQFKTTFKSNGGDKLFSRERLLIVVNDGFRNTVTELILDWLLRLNENYLQNTQFLIATGAHDAPTEEHLRKIFGKFYGRLKKQISFHDAKDKSLMVKVGYDQFDEEVWVNRMLFDYDHVCLIGSVEPHYFAGYTGGRKSIFPGLADFKTVERNHNMANSLEAAPLKIKGNPVAEHLGALLKMLDISRFFSMQTVIDAQKQLAGVFMGDLNESFQEAVSLAKKIFTHKVDLLYDIVLCEVMPPLDSNLYQAQKALENCQVAVKDGGAVIVVSACSEGVGSKHFWALADKWDKENNTSQDGKMHFGSHKLSRVISMGERINTFLYSTLDDHIIKHVFYEPMHDLKSYLEPLILKKDIERLAVVHNAGHTVLWK